MNPTDAGMTCSPLWEALATCPPLKHESPERDRLWLIVRDLVCTRSSVAVTPMGSESQVLVTSDYASDELIAAMTWLHTHEEDARQLRALDLFVRLRGVATRVPRLGTSSTSRCAPWHDRSRPWSAHSLGRPRRERCCMTFEAWVANELGVSTDAIDSSLLAPAFEVLISRCEEARRRGAADTLVTVSPKRAGGNSRACTRRMLAQLGLSDAQRRVMHRLLAGSPGGWPGLLSLFCAGASLTPRQRQYARRQLSNLLPRAVK